MSPVPTDGETRVGHPVVASTAKLSGPTTAGGSNQDDRAAVVHRST